MRGSLKARAAAILLILGTTGLYPGLASNLSVPKMDDAVKSYRDKQYSQSLAQFKQLHNSGVCNELIHYYMALCYQATNQIASAKQQYTTVAKGKIPSLRANAQSALAALERWNLHRAYQGNGNNFERYSVARNTGSRFGGAGRSASGPPLKEIVIDMPPPSGGGC